MRLWLRAHGQSGGSLWRLSDHELPVVASAGLSILLEKRLEIGGPGIFGPVDLPDFVAIDDVLIEGPPQKRVRLFAVNSGSGFLFGDLEGGQICGFVLKYCAFYFFLELKPLLVGDSRPLEPVVDVLRQVRLDLLGLLICEL